MKYSTITALVMLLSFSSFAQVTNCSPAPNCIVNSSLLSSNGVYGDLYPYGNAHIPGWDISHGTPTHMGETEGIWMWSYNGQTSGEGIYTCYNFVQNHTYKVCLDIKSSSQPGTLGYINGFFFIQATNGNFSRPIPIANQLIAGWNMTDQAFTRYTFTFTANRNYNKLWLFPYMPNPPAGVGSQYEATVKNINVEEVPSVSSVATVSGNTISVLNSPGNGYWSWSNTAEIISANSDSSIVTLAEACIDRTIKAVYINSCKRCTIDTIKTVVAGIVPPTVQITGKTKVCEGISVTLTATGATSYQWQPEHIYGDQITVAPQTSTRFTVIGTTGICSSSSTHFVTVMAAYQETNTDSICSGESYLLPDGRLAKTPGTYKSVLTSTDGCDSLITTILHAKDCFQSLLIPTLITPNGDGKNDYFEIPNLPVESILRIYNRWGNLVYHNKRYNHEWGGEENVDGLYFYDLILPDNRQFKGWIELLR